MYRDAYHGCMTDVDAIERELQVFGGHDLGWALSVTMRWFHRNAAEVVADLPGGPRGFTVLHLVSTGGCRNQAAIADSLGIDRTVLTYLLDELEERGLVERRPDPRDRRARQIVATDRGLELLVELRARIGAVQEGMLETLGERDAATFTDLLSRLSERATAAGHDGGDCETVA